MTQAQLRQQEAWGGVTLEAVLGQGPPPQHAQQQEPQQDPQPPARPSPAAAPRTSAEENIVDVPGQCKPQVVGIALPSKDSVAAAVASTAVEVHPPSRPKAAAPSTTAMRTALRRKTVPPPQFIESMERLSALHRYEWGDGWGVRLAYVPVDSKWCQEGAAPARCQ